MTLQLKLNGTDFTAKWRPYESRWSMRAWNGESSTSEFVIDDFDGAIDHDDLNARKIVEVWEDASGTPVCIYHGRISNKALGMGPSQVQPAMRWTIQAEDYNIELRGIRVNEAERPEETDEARFEAIRVAMLVGAASTHPEARQSTDLDNTYLGGGTAIDLPEEHYEDTYPADIFQQIVELTGRIFFVYLADDGTGELYYGDRSDMALLADIEIDDDAPASADGIDKFAPYKGPQAGDHGGQGVLTGGAVRYEDGLLYEESNIGGSEAVYDRWETTVSNDFIHSDNTAMNLLNKTVTNHDEDQTYFATIDMRPEDVHRLKAGMMVPLTRKRANKLADDAARAVVVTYEPVKPNAAGESWYRVTAELGRPQTAGTLPKSRRKIPRPTQPTVPGGDVVTGRLYYTGANDVTSGLNSGTDRSGDWTNNQTGNNSARRLRNSPQNTLTNTGGGHSWAATGAAAANVASEMWTCPLSESAGVLATVQNGGTWRTVIRSKNRTGTGIVLATQENYPDWTIRVYRPGTGFIGTLFDVGDFTAAYKFDINSAVWPSIPMTATGAAVPTAVATDYLVVELGAKHVGPTSGGTGSAYRQADSSDTDLPFIVDGVQNYNSWLEASSSGGGGGTAGDGRPDLIGTEHNCYKRCDDTESFDSTLLDDGPRAPTPEDDVTQGFRVGTHWLDPDTGRTYWATDVTAGAAVWVLVGDPGAATPGSTLTIEEEDGDPSGIFDTLKVPDGSLTDNLDGSASLDVALAVHSHVPPSGDGFRGVSLRRSTNFTSTNANTSIPDFDVVEYDTDAFYDAGDPERITIPAAFDGLMMQFYAMGLWATNTDNYTEMKLYRNGTAVEAPIAVTQHVPATSFNTGQELITRPVQVSTGDYFTITFRTPANETVLTYDDMSLVFAGWMVGGGVVLSDDVPLVESGAGAAGTSPDSSRSDHVHPAAGGGGSGGVPPAILLESGHAVPFTFDEILQESDGSDFLWASE